jgi:hypothetical protein
VIAYGYDGKKGAFLIHDPNANDGQGRLLTFTTAGFDVYSSFEFVGGPSMSFNYIYAIPDWVMGDDKVVSDAWTAAEAGTAGDSLFDGSLSYKDDYVAAREVPKNGVISVAGNKLYLKSPGLSIRVYRKFDGSAPESYSSGSDGWAAVPVTAGDSTLGVFISSGSGTENNWNNGFVDFRYLTLSTSEPGFQVQVNETPDSNGKYRLYPFTSATVRCFVGGKPVDGKKIGWLADGLTLQVIAPGKDANPNNEAMTFVRGLSSGESTLVVLNAETGAKITSIPFTVAGVIEIQVPMSSMTQTNTRTGELKVYREDYFFHISTDGTWHCGGLDGINGGPWSGDLPGYDPNEGETSTSLTGAETFYHKAGIFKLVGSFRTGFAFSGSYVSKSDGDTWSVVGN